MSKGYISEAMNGGRIVAHGQITDLSAGFKLPKGELFTVYIRPKFNTSTLDTTLSVRCQQDKEFSDAPVVFNDWSPLAIAEIAPSSNDLLQTNDLYWGSGEYVSNGEEA